MRRAVAIGACLTAFGAGLAIALLESPVDDSRVGSGTRVGVEAKAPDRVGARAIERLFVRTLGPRLALVPADVGFEGSRLRRQTLSDDPAVVARRVRAALARARRAHVIAAVGHFPGQGGASGDPNTGPASVGLSLDELRARDLRPFAAVAGIAPVIVASNATYAAFDGATPAVLLPEAIDGLLRRDLNYRGVVMTDDLTAASATAGLTIGEAAVAALRAGADLIYVPGPPRVQAQAYRAVLRAYRHGTISTARIRASLRRIAGLRRGRSRRARARGGRRAPSPRSPRPRIPGLPPPAGRSRGA
jgi:beta-N-acetylhexosaminidase